MTDTLNRTIDVLHSMPRGNPVVIRDQFDEPIAVMYRYADDPKRLSRAREIRAEHAPAKRLTRRERKDRALSKRRMAESRIRSEKHRRTAEHERNRMAKLRRKPSVVRGLGLRPY